MAGRSTKPHINRRNHYQQQIAKAETPKSMLWAYCHWLVAEAFHAGPDRLTQVTDLVRDQIDQLTAVRKETNR